MISVYIINHEYIITDMHRRVVTEKHPGAELVITFKTIQAARSWALRHHHVVQDFVTSSYTGTSPAGRARIRAAKLGSNNPNAQGLSEQHKHRISLAMKHRRGEFHHFYNHRHTMRSRLQISVSMRETWKHHPSRWAVDEHECSHRIHGTLPLGWRWGRVKFR